MVSFARQGLFFLLIIGAVILLSSSYAFAQTTHPNDNSPLGTNLNSVNYYSPEIPFIDVFKTTSTWITTYPGVWDTGEESKLDVDQNGWVKSLTPVNGQTASYTSVVTLFMRSFPPPYYAAGRYIVTYDGEGTIIYSFDAKKNTSLSTTGRDVLDVTPSDAGIALTIAATDPNHTGNYIRNIKVFRADQESLLQNGEIFNTDFLDRTKKYRELRFIDWMSTNNSTQSSWSARNQVNDYTYGKNAGGVPVEIMVALANKLHADPWFTIPAHADDNFVQNFAQTVNTSLDATLKVYVEDSNEVWNGQFQQSAYESALGAAQTPAIDGLQYHALRTRQIGNIFKSVLGTNRVVTTLAAQAANPYTATHGLDYLQTQFGSHGIDAVAIAPYFAVTPNPTEASTFDAMSLNQLFAYITSTALPTAIGYMTSYTPVATTYGVHLISYEGGQHLVGILGAENDTVLTTLLTSANRDARMGQIYATYLNAWKQNGGELFTHYADIGSYSKWGSWGSLENVMQTSSPKYDTLSSFIDTTPCWWSSCTRSTTVSTPPASQPLLGDLNSDHIVNALDWSLMNAKWFTTDTVTDLNRDGVVNAIDFSLLNANWFKTW